MTDNNIVDILSIFNRGEKEVLRKLCNSYFLETVSSLSFGDGTPPSNDAVSTLMEYVVEQENPSVTVHFKTKSSILLDSTDDSPVARSFILQLLLRSRYSMLFVTSNMKTLTIH